MALSNDILSSTLRILVAEEVDNLHKAIPFFNEIQGTGGVETYSGGSRIDRPLILAEHSQITQLTTGYEPVNLAVSDVLRHAQYNWNDFVAPIVITKKEELSNRGDDAVISIADARMKSVMGMLKREWEKQAIAGSSTVLTEMQTLNGFGAALGWFEEGAFGSGQSNSVGGLSKSTYQGQNWNNQVADAGDAFNTSRAGEGAMTDLMIQTQIYAPEGTVDLILASPTSYKLYKQSLRAQEQYVKETVLDGGRLALAFSGALIYVENNLGFTESGTDASMYFLNSKSMKVVFDKDANFSLSDFQDKSGYAAREAHLYVRTQLVADHLASMGVLINGES